MKNFLTLQGLQSMKYNIFFVKKSTFVVATQKGCAKGLLFCRQNNTDNMSEYQFADWLKTATDLKSCEKM
jgi:hypothetical protein